MKKGVAILSILMIASCIQQEYGCTRVESPFESLELVSEITVTENVFIEVSTDQMKAYAHGQPVYCILNAQLKVSDEWGRRTLKKSFSGNAGWVSFVFIEETKTYYVNWKPAEGSNVSYEEGVFVFCS